VDRLIAVVLVRFKIELRALLFARERALGALLMLPFGVLFALLGAAAVFFGTRMVEASAPAAVGPLLSLLATAVGLAWALSPLLAGVTLTESHDLARLMHFPIPLRGLVAASLVSNLLRPAVLLELPVAVALAAALSARPILVPFALLGVLLTLGLVVATAQAFGFALHALSRNRRLNDVALFVGLGLGFLMSAVPLVVFAGGGRSFGFLGALLRRDVALFSPFGWGVRAALHAGHGEWGTSAAFALASLAATGAALGVSALLVSRIYTGELDLGAVRAGAAVRRRALGLPGVIGALVDKDLRVTWRDPALKAVLFMGLIGPLVFLFLLSGMRETRAPGTSVLLLASLVGLSGLGGNAFGLERRGIALLLGFPVARWRILVAKNVGTLAFRIPGMATVALATLLLVRPSYLPAALTILLASLAIASGLDNYASILFPLTVPAPGTNPYGGAAGGRGLTAVLMNFAMLLVALVVSGPFVFLAWLPLLLHARWLWAFSLPLALAGALAVYAMLIGGASNLLSRREPEMLERILGESWS
jgi:hypothetical protein